MRHPKDLQAIAILCSWLVVASAHKDGAGSCNSPRSITHTRSSSGTGDYVLTVHPKQHTSPTEVVFRLKSRSHQPFRGFQIVCEACVFLNLPKEDAHLNEKYCPQMGGRVTHTNNTDKAHVEIEARLEPQDQTEIDIRYFVVRSVHDWYGPLHLKIDSAGQVVERADASIPESTFDADFSLPQLTDDDDADDDEGAQFNASDDDDEEANDRGQTFDDDDEFTHNKCRRSTKPDFSCMAEIKGFFRMHWSILNETGPRTQIDQTRIEILLEVETSGWAALSFAGIKGKMHPADAVLGWVEDNGRPNVHAYHIEEDDVSARNQNGSLFRIYSIHRRGDWLHVRFARYIQSGIIRANLDEGVFLNYATGKSNSLIEHDRWGSLVLDFLTGETESVSSRKYYQTHGALMVIAWIVLVPLSLTIARSKWSPQGMGLYGWLDLHRGLHVFAVIALVSALLIAVMNFQSIHSRSGRVHRLLGILTTLFFFGQILMGIRRPSAESLYRSLFVAGHTWGGRSLALLACLNVFIGISAFHLKTNSSPSPWIAVVLLLLAVQFCIALFFELIYKPQLNRRGEVAEVDMVQIPYARPGEQDSDEHYTSD